MRTSVPWHERSPPESTESQRLPLRQRCMDRQAWPRSWRAVVRWTRNGTVFGPSLNRPPRGGEAG